MNPKDNFLVKRINTLLLLALIVAQVCTFSVTNVALKNQATTSALVGSVLGGTKLYIEGVGFSTSMGDMSVTVGGLPCLIEDGATDTSLLCATTSIGVYQDLNDLSISVTMTDKGTVTAAQRFSYKVSATPYLTSVYPSVSYGGSQTLLYWTGVHRITDLGEDKMLGDIHALYIGDSICSRFGIYQEAISNPNAKDVIKCYQPTRQKAGKYNLSEHLFPGKSWSWPMSYKFSETNELYQFVVLPLVNSTTNTGSVAGQEMKIQGTGFSTDPKQIEVKVDGVDCKISESTLTKILCRLDQKTTQPSSSLSSSQATPVNPYFSGSGFSYKRYNISQSPDRTAKGLKTALDSGDLSKLTLLEEYISGEIATANVLYANYGQVWKGYFVPTVTGKHKFRGVADDGFAVYLESTVYGSTVALDTTKPIAWTESFTPAADYFNFERTDRTGAQSADIILTAGRAYYMEVYHVNRESYGSFQLAVQMPPANPSIKRWQTHEVQTITTNSLEDPEIIEFNSIDAISGTITLAYSEVSTSTGLSTVDQKTTFNWNATDSEFCTAIKAITWFGNYAPTCALDMKTFGGTPTTDPKQAAEFTWIVTILKNRGTVYPARIFKASYSDKVGQFKQTSVQDHSAPISGTFTLTIGGVEVKMKDSTGARTMTGIPTNTNAETLRDAIRQSIQGMENVEVDAIGDFGVSGKWIIYYFGYNKDIPLPTVVNIGMTGGGGGVKPTIVAAMRREYSSNSFVNPIDYRWMKTPSDKPNVQVTVKNIPSACNANCKYEFKTQADVPQLTAVSLQGYTVTISLSDPKSLGSLPKPLALLTITIDGQPCLNLDGLLTSFTCTLPKNLDNTTPILRAGKHYPDIFIKDVGYVIANSAVSAIDIPLTITPSNMYVSALNGGQEIVLQGAGFPLDKSQITFTLCGKTCMINRISNTEAAIVVPTCSQTEGKKVLTATYGSITATAEFTYTALDTSVSITAISPTSASPVLKGFMKITGTGFGTDPLGIQVWMTNSTGNIYRMKVINVTDTEIFAGIPGGLPGLFDINIIKQNFGYAVTTTGTQNDFKYEVKVTSVSPSSGSFYGGTLITIRGVNFVNDALQTMVTVGDQLNQLCKIESISATEIKCRTPPKHADDATDTKLEVEVMSQLIIPTNCNIGDDCWFQYTTAATSPTLDVVPAQPADLSTAVTLTGTKFDMGAVTVAFYNKVTKKVTEVNPEGTPTATSVQVKYPVLEEGFYTVKVRVGAIGQTNGKDLTYNLAISSPSTIGVSTQGAEISLLGAGFPDSWPNKYYNNISFSLSGKNLPLQVVSTNAGKFTFKVPKGVDNTDYTLKITSSFNKDLSKSIKLQQRTTNTPTVTLASSPTISPNTLSSIQLQRATLPTVQPQFIEVYSVSNPTKSTKFADLTFINQKIVFDVTLKSGKYGFRLFDSGYGWYTTTAFVTVSKSGSYSFNPTVASYNGGLFKVTGDYIGQGAVIKVQGLVGNYVSGTDTQAYFSIPRLITLATKSLFQASESKVIDLSTKTLQGDSPNFKAAFDKNYYTTYSSPNAACNLIIDIGVDKAIQLAKIRYFPTTQWNVASSKLQDAQFLGSNDKITWTAVGTVDSTVHSGWNTIMPADSIPLYRYIKFAHTSQSGCKLAEIQISGIELSTITIQSMASFVTNADFFDGAYTQTFDNAIEYKQTKTPVITNVSPATGNIRGGYTLTLTGNYLDIGTPIVKIDGVECKNPVQTLTGITCTVQERKERVPKTTSFTVEYDGIPAIIKKEFKYVLRWSDPTTWGTDLPPVAGDLVYVPEGMHLLIDESTPVLKGIVVENAILEFADQKEMTIEAGFITLKGGQFIAGTKDKPYQNKLTFIMHGNYYGEQQPMLGNKGIGCVECKLQMNGQTRLPTWTMISATINPDDTQFTVIQDVDWKVGETIVVASTSYDHNEAEQRVITSVTNKRTITVDRKFLYKHYSGEQTYGSDKLVMRAEVALLTRNIKMMGDDTSVAKDYGSHLMIAGKASNGAIGQIAYVEFTKCGQPQIVGRYCHHFHLTGDSPDSYSIGNSVHHSMARILTIHGTHMLYVAWNVGYRVKGHNFFLQDGIETNNVIEHNLAISSLLVNNMMQTDMSVASYWITNPTNIVRNNHAAGSDFYGFWYEIKEHPDGPSATQDICPIGNPMGESRDNVAHSNIRFGLRIFHYYARQNPCEPIRDDTALDPWGANPSIEAKFENYVLWKNGEAGLLAEHTGNVVFENFIIAESKLAGMEFYRTNFTKEPTIARNFAIIGRSDNNPPASDSQLDELKGAILSRTGHMSVENIRFYNFPTKSTIWESCSKCDNVLLYTNLGAVYKASQISYTNILGKYYHMKGMQREIFYDLDGTLTNRAGFNTRQITSGTLVKGFPHLLQDPACQSATTPLNWDYAAVCNQDVQLQHVMFTNINDEQVFRNQPIKARMLTTFTETTSPTQEVFTAVYSLQKNKEPMIQKRYAYSLPFIQNRIYNIWWGKGIDFKTIMMRTSPYFPLAQPGVLFKFNYTAGRELFDVTPLRQGKKLDATLMKNEKAAIFTNSDIASCKNGEYFHDNTKSVRHMFLCANGQNRTYSEYLNVTSVPCRFKCPPPPGECVKQTFRRTWNNATQWPGAVMPQADKNVTIPCEWTIDLDMNPLPIDVLIIEGNLTIPDTQDFTIQAKTIWINNGHVKAGEKNTPFTHKLTFQINGLKNDAGIVVSPALAGNKLFVNTGRLELFGVAPEAVWTKMTAFADKESNQITVESTTGWAVGDQIAIAPSFMGQAEFEKVTITNINDKIVTFTPVLKYNHFGDVAPTIVKSFGTLDTRTGVGHLTRNIKIQAGPDNGWGFSLIQFSYLRRVVDVDNEIDTDVWTTGKMTISGVEFIKGGQYDTMEAGLQIINVKTKAENTLIEKSSFHDCQDLCMRVQNSQQVEINNNVLYIARRFHIRALSITKFTFTNNLMIGVTSRPEIIFNDLRACFAAYDHIDTKTAAIRVNDNLCQGSQGHGFAVPHVDCSDMENYPFQRNTVGSSEFGWIFSRGIGSCLSAKGCYAYSTQVGNIHDPSDGFMLKFKNFIFADSARAMTIRLGGDIPEKTAFLYDSYITAISRPTCTKCYGETANKCVGNQGMRMLTTGLNSQELPFKFGYVYDVVCKAETIDGKVFVYNTEFENFRQTYTNIGLTQCQKNVIFKPHPIGTSFVASHHLFNTSCTGCQVEAFAYFSPPPQKQRGWFGGCGDILCTGFNNYIIEDHTGDFLPQKKKGTLLPNNSWIGDNQAGCEFVPQINGHLCNDRQDFAVMQYQSIAPDYNTRIMWPVYLQYDGGNWTSVTNGWRQWQWAGTQPLNKRLGRFVSTVRLYKMYNLSFTSQPPTDMTFQLQRKLPQGDPENWVIVKIYYPRPNSVKVQVGGKVISPILINGSDTKPLDTAVCGSNKFFYQNYTIHFVVTGDANCKVRVTLTGSIQLTAKFDMPINDFFQTVGVTKFINQICALFNIVDKSRVKVVGVIEGSSLLNALITFPQLPPTATASQIAAAQIAFTALKTSITNTINSPIFQQGMKAIGLGPLLTVTATLIAQDPVRCATTYKVDGVDICTSCNFGYQLTDVYLDDDVRETRCLSFEKNEYIRHCNRIIYDTTHKVYQCKSCNDKYLEIKVIIDGYEYQKCISNNQKVENCTSYILQPKSCSFLCGVCHEGRTISLFKQFHRTRRMCLLTDSQSLPNCDLYTVDIDKQYYCRSRHCAKEATEIPIGPLPAQIACTKFAFLPQCAYYSRPKSTDVALACAKSK